MILVEDRPFFPVFLEEGQGGKYVCKGAAYEGVGILSADPFFAKLPGFFRFKIGVFYDAVQGLFSFSAPKIWKIFFSIRRPGIAEVL